MFEQTFVEVRRSGRGWAVGGSLALQTALAALAAVFPLLAHYRIPLHVLQQNLVLLTPPPPPAPPAPPLVKLEQTPRVERFSEVLRQPAAIPERVALLDDSPRLTALSAAAPGLEGGVEGGTGASPTLLPFLAPPPVAKPIPVGGQVQAARILVKVRPVYPPDAIEQNISGAVLLSAIIARDGSIKELTLSQGHPMLAPAAIEAVRQWRYKPTVLNGRPVEVQTVVEVIFNLIQPPEPEEEPGRRRRKR